MDVETRVLRSFLSVAEELNFTRAAERLFLSQQALSAQIRRLERATGATLFARTTHSVKLTAAGHALVPAAQHIIDTIDQAERAIRVAAEAAPARLNVGFTVGAAAEMTNAILAEFGARCPEVAVDLHEAPFRDPTAGLGQQRSDVGLVRLPLTGAEFEYAELFSEPRVLVVPAHHRLADRSEISLSEIADEPLLTVRSDCQEWNGFWLAADARGGTAPATSRIVDSVDEELLLVATQGFLTITAASVERYASRPGVRFVPITDIAPSVVAIAWRRGTAIGAIGEFVAAARHVSGAARVHNG
ncbi:LysR substrate-binding domain-containing protein [Leucobacter albus]|uniref:LysR substrate-binding domain-containing protein n=1 Tax=Leucobacter albus TaxID=272210 RepID=A0ABW3TP37_9MICO